MAPVRQNVSQGNRNSSDQLNSRELMTKTAKKYQKYWHSQCNLQSRRYAV